MLKLLLMCFFVFVFAISCQSVENLDGTTIAKLVFDIITYIFTAVLGVLGGAKFTKKK